MSHYRLTISTFLPVELRHLHYTVVFFYLTKEIELFKRKKNLDVKKKICIRDAYILEQLMIIKKINMPFYFIIFARQMFTTKIYHCEICIYQKINFKINY
jgi:hypothetical protein